MRGSRVSIAGVMLAVVAVGLGLSALTRPSELAANAAFTVAMASMGAAILGAVLARGVRRAGWLGYLLFAGVYLALSLGPWPLSLAQPHLIASPLLDSAYDRLTYTPDRIGERVWVRAGYEAYREGVLTLNRSNAPEYFVERFDGAQAFLPASDIRPLSPDAIQRLGHSLFTLAAGLVGAVVARRIAAREQCEPGGPSE